MEEDEERVEERQVNEGAESQVEALNKVEMRDGTQTNPLGGPTLAEQTKLVDVVIKDTQVDEEANS